MAESVTPENIRTGLIDLVKRSQADEQAFRALFTPEERARVGTVEKWAPKEVIAHLGYWKNRQAERMRATARGDAPPFSPEFQQANEESWHEFAPLDWDACVARSDQAGRDLLAALEAAPASLFAHPEDPNGQAGQLIGSTLGNSSAHLAEHMAYYYEDRGDPATAMRVRHDDVARVVAAGLGAPAEGAARYNLACYQALHSQPAAALDELRQAFAQRPDLIAWARQDTDLDSLRNDPAFQALVPAEG